MGVSVELWVCQWDDGCVGRIVGVLVIWWVLSADLISKCLCDHHVAIM